MTTGVTVGTVAGTITVELTVTGEIPLPYADRSHEYVAVKVFGGTAMLAKLGPGRGPGPGPALTIAAAAATCASTVNAAARPAAASASHVSLPALRALPAIPTRSMTPSIFPDSQNCLPIP